MASQPARQKGYWARAYDDFFGMRTLIYLTILVLITGITTHWNDGDLIHAFDMGLGISVLVSLLRAWRTGQPDKRKNGQ